MNILQVTLGFYPAMAWGGPTKVVYQNSQELLRRGHQVTIYCTNLLDKKHKIRPGTFEAEVDGLRVVYLNTWNFSYWPGTLGPFWLPDLPAYLRREVAGYDIVHLNGYRSPMILLPSRAARVRHIPIVIQTHGMLPVVMGSFRAKRLYDRFFARMELSGIAAFIALQESERQQAIARGVPAHRIEMIPNGIATRGPERWERGRFRRRYGFDLKRPLILFLGRINRIKGSDMLVEAFARLEDPEAQLAIAGPDDGQLSEVKKLISRYGLGDRISFTGCLGDAEVRAAYEDSDIFVLPSRADAYPTTLMEACAFNTPMVITDRCEIAELVRNRVAEVVPFDPAAFAAAIQRLLMDKDLYNRYRANCPAVLEEKFSLQAVVDRLEKVYERVITERRKR